MRYSEAFKMQVISELESGKVESMAEARRKYSVNHVVTIKLNGYTTLLYHHRALCRCSCYVVY